MDPFRPLSSKTADNLVSRDERARRLIREHATGVEEPREPEPEGEPVKCETVKCQAQTCRSWACPRCSGILSQNLGRQLRYRFTERRAVMVTLTLDRTKFATPREGYDWVKQQRSIPRSLEAWCNAHGISSKGAWLAKMELQKSGWPHWHVLVEVPPDFLCARKGSFDDFWPHGFSNVRSQGVSVGYLAKYTAKGTPEDVTEAVIASGLPAQGVKWVTSSHGFWSGVRQEARPGKKRGEVGWPPPEHWENGELRDRIGLCMRFSLIVVEDGGEETFRELVQIRPESLEMMVPLVAHLGHRKGFTWLRVPRGATTHTIDALGLDTEGWWHNEYDSRFARRAGRRPVSICM